MALLKFKNLRSGFRICRILLHEDKRILKNNIDASFLKERIQRNYLQSYKMRLNKLQNE
jgi:hypothetical protein